MLRLVRRFWVSFFAAVIFAMHPVATESVTNIIGRADMFAATTVVGGMLIWIDIHRSQGWKRLLWLTALLVLTLFGVFSKETPARSSLWPFCMTWSIASASAFAS